jgi:Phage tail protein
MDITISLTGANGDTITFDNVNYILENGVSGFGRPPVKIRIDENATDGGTFRYSRRATREIDLPMYVLGTSRDDVEQKLRRLSELLDSSTGPTVISATYASGQTWTITGYNIAGGSHVYGDNALQTFARLVLVFQCPQPFWSLSTAVSLSIGVAATSGRGLFGSGNSLTAMKVTSGQVLGQLRIENPDGDVPSPATWVLTGPFDTATITNAAGVGFTVNAQTTSGNYITIDTNAGTVVDQSGTNKYSSLASAPKLFSIPPNSSLASVNLTGATIYAPTSVTRAQLTFQPRKEVVF